MLFDLSDPIFNNLVIADPDDWSTKYPDVSEIYKGVMQNPNLAIDMGFKVIGVGSNKFLKINNTDTALNYLGRLSFKSDISASRQLTGYIASNLGMLSNETSNIIDTFKEKDLDKLSNKIDVANKIIKQGLDLAVQQGLDGIGAIPIVGWIIKAVGQVGLIVAQAFESYYAKKAEEATEILQEQYSVPVFEFNESVDEGFAREVLKNIKLNNFQWVFSPRSYINNIKDIYAVRGKTNPGQDALTKFFYIFGEQEGGNTYGLGFIPGTRNINDGIGMHASGCGSNVFDTGIYYPTAASIANSLWSFLLKEGNIMYTVDPVKAKSDWENHMYWLYRFADESLSKGWGCVPTSKTLTNQYLCSEEMDGYFSNNSSSKCKKSRYAEYLNIPSGYNNVNKFRAFLNLTFFDNGVKLINKNKKIDADNVDYSESIPSRNLNNLHDRQAIYLDSMNAIYVNKEYNSIKNNFKNKWTTNVTKIINSDMFYNISFKDVPEGEVRQVIQQKCNNLNKDCNDLGKNLDLKILGAFGNVSAPTPYNPVDVQPMGISYKNINTWNKKGSSASSAPLILGGAALGALALIFRK